MKIESINDLPIGEELFLGPSHQQFCNRYLRHENNTVEVQRIVRFGKDGDTRIMTAQEFNAWRKEIAAMRGQ